MKRSLIVLSTAAILVATGILLSASSLQVPSGTWIAAGPINSAESGASTALLQDGRMLVTGGNRPSGPLTTAELFGANGSFSLATSMNVPRSGHVSVVLQDGRVLVAGGTTTGGAVTNTAEIFDPAKNTWTNVTRGMIEARSGHTAALLQDGRVLIAGGQNGSAISSTLEIFDPSLGVFSFAGMMSSPRTQHAMAVLSDGRVLIVGGNKGTGAVSSADIFNPVAGRVSAGPSLSVARYGHSATTLLNGQVVVIGGNNGKANPAQMDVTPAEIFDPAAATPAFTPLASNLATPREGHLAFLLPNNNNVLIVGGTSGGAALASAELFMPQQSTQGIWTYLFGPTGSMGTARSGATGAANQVSAPSSVMQRNGVLLVAGGVGSNGNALKTSEVYGFATVQTDHGDYPPGTMVTITGSGWQPGEKVALQLVESPLIDTHGPYSVTADANGNISDSSFSTDEHDLDVQFTLTAVGSVSRAQMRFTDSSNFQVSGSVKDDVTGSGLSGVTVNFYASSSSSCSSISAWAPASTTTASGGTYTATGTKSINTLCIVMTAPANYAASGAVAGSGSSAVNSSEISTPDGNAGGASTGNNFFVHKTGTVETIAASNAAAPYSNSAQSVPLTAVVTSTDGTVNTGTVTFTIADGATTIGTATSGNVTSGSASVNYSLPAHTAVKSYTIQATYKTGGGTTDISDTSHTLSVNSIPLTVTGITASSKIYDGGTTATLNTSGATLVGVISGDTVTLDSSSYTANFADKNVANGKSITVAGLGLSGASAGNYLLTQPSGLTGNVTPKALTYSGLTVPASKPYDATTTATVSGSAALQAAETPGTGTSSDGKPYNVDSVNLSGTPTGTYNSKDVVTAAIVNFGGISMTGTGNGNYTLTVLTQAATITAGGVTITANNKTKAYGQAVTFAGTEFISSGLVSPDTITSVTLSSTGAAATAAVAGSPYSIVPSAAVGTGLANYTISYVNGTMTVSPGTLTITANNRTKAYGQAVTFAGTEFITSGLVSPDTVTSVTLTSTGAAATATLAGSPYSIVPSAAVGTGLANYTISYVNGTMTVNPAAVTVTANNQSKAYGQAVTFAGTEFITSGLVSPDTITSVTLTSTGAAATATVAGSPYSIVPSVAVGTGLANYTISYVNGSLTVTPATLTYTANAASKSYGAANPTFSGTVTGFVGTDTQENSTTGTMTFTSPATTSSAVGSYAINGSGLTATNGNYTLVQAPANATALTVTQAALTITANNRTKAYGQAVTFAGTEFITSGLVSPDTVTSVTLTSTGAAATAAVAGSPYSIVPSAAVGTGLANYAISYVNGTMTVNPAAVTVTANNRTKAYGQAVTFAGTEFVTSGLVSPDTITSVTLTSTGAAATATVAGSPYSIVPSEAIGTGLANYTISYVNGSLTVTQATLTYTANAASKSYGAANPTFSGTVTGFIGTDTQANSTTGTLTFTSPATTSSAMGSYAINGSGLTATGGNYTFAQAPANATALTVTTATLTITANNRTKAYGQAVTFAGTEFITSGLVSPDSVTSVTLTSTGAAATATVAGSPYSIAPSAAVGTGLANYTISYVNGALTVSPGTLTITANNRTKAYGQAVTFAGTEFITSGLVSPDSVTSVTLTSTGAAATATVAGSPYSIVPSAAVGTGLANYTISYVNGSLTVAQATLTYTANAASKSYGAANPTFSGTLTGFVGTDTQENSTTGTMTFTSPATTSSAVGSYAINGSGLTATNGNYTLVQAPANATALTVTQAALTITANNRTKAYGQAVTFAGTEFISSGLMSPDTVTSVTLTSTGAAATAAVAGSPYSIVPSAAVGTGLANYSISYVNGALTVSPGTLTITANNRTKAYGQAVTFAGTEFITSGLVSPDSVTSVTLTSTGAAATATVAGSPYSIVPSAAVGTGLANYTISYVNGSLTVTQATLTYTANAASKSYGAVNPAFTGTVTGFVGTDTQANSTTGTLTFTSTATTSSAVGSYAINGSGLTATSGSYTFAQAPANATALTVTAATLTYTANAASRSYGAANPTFTGTVTGFVGTDTQANSTTGTLTFTSPATTSSALGSYAINGSGLTATSGNYTFTQAPGNATALTVTTAALTITANNRTKAYGQAVTFAGTEFITSGLVSPDSVTSVTLTSTGAAATATVAGSPYSIVPSAAVGTGLANYTISYANGSLTVTQATLTYTANAASRSYGAANPTFSGTVTGFVGTDTQANSTTGTLTFTSTATTSSKVGSYAINGSGLTATSGSYTFAQAPANATALTISPATLTYTANTATRIYGSTNPAFTGIVAGFVGSDTQANSTTGTLTFTSPAITSSKVGSYAINGSGLTANNGNYTFVQAPANATALTISPATLTYKANTAIRGYGVANPTFSGTVTGFVGSDTQANATTGTLTFTSPATISSPIGSYAINGSGLTANNGNYTFVQAATNATALTITQLTLTYTANPVSRTYGSNNPTFTGTVTGFVGSDTQANSTTGTLTFTSSTTHFNAVGSYSITGSGLTSTNGNYTFVQAASNSTALTITPATLTYTANAASRSYGSANPVFAGTVTGFVNSETIASATQGTLTFTSPATASSIAGNYAINGSGLIADNNNYLFVQAAANASALTITKATPTVTVFGGTFVYDTNSHPATATAVGADGHTAVSGSFSFMYTPPGNSIPPTNLGTYAVVVSFTSSDSNYTNAIGSGSIFITPVVNSGFTDNSNVASTPFNSTSIAGDMLFVGGDTNPNTPGYAYTGVPTFSEGNAMASINNFTTSDGNLNQAMWTNYSITGGDIPTITCQTATPISGPNANYGGCVYLELKGVNTLDVVGTPLGLVSYSGSTITSNSITTTHDNEVAVCLAGHQGNGGFTGGGSGWTGVAFSSQGIQYKLVPTSGTVVSCSMNLNGNTSDYVINIASFYKSSGTSTGSTPSRVQGTACEGSGASVNCTLGVGVTPGDVLVWGATAAYGNSAPTITATDNCGGTSKVVDAATVSGTTNGVAQGYSTGSSGSCTVTFSAPGAAFVTGVLEEMTPGTLDQHSLLAGQSVSAGGTVTTTSVTTTAADYAFSYAVDASASGGGPTTVAPFTAHDVNYVFGEQDADSTQSASGALTAAWKYVSTTTGASVGMMTFQAPQAP